MEAEDTSSASGEIVKAILVARDTNVLLDSDLAVAQRARHSETSRPSQTTIRVHGARRHHAGDDSQEPARH